MKLESQPEGFSFFYFCSRQQEQHSSGLIFMWVRTPPASDKIPLMLEADPTYPEPNPIISINHNLIPLRETNLPCLSEDYLYKGKIWFLKAIKMLCCVTGKIRV
ncbi:hypothetical protein GOODEAATRI_030814 [Goodea atripinnis]|uniref:Uncharacterized protein n=1 Tax=Goodea atripinnis TaxID=208336 RepID=A0ABV0P936_9TELE